MAQVPPIPDVKDAVAVARWFVEYDAALEPLRTCSLPQVKEWVVEEIRYAVQGRDGRRLRQLYRKWSDMWITHILPRSAARYQSGPPFSELDECMLGSAALWEAQTRILGYIVEQMAAREKAQQD